MNRAPVASLRLPRLDSALAGPSPQERRRIFDGFLDMARHRPDSVAIVGSTTRLTYGQLEERTRHLGRRLAAHTAPASLVAVYGKRDANTVLAMLACLRAGRVFAVLDSTYPARRLAQLLSELAAPPLLLLDATEEDGRIVDTIARPDAVLRLTGTELGSDADDAPGAPIDEARPEEIAYVLFTSGTTGVPKAVRAAHSPLVHFVDWYAGRFNAGPGSRFSMLSGIAHDPVLRDVFVPLTVGGQLHIPAPRLLSDPAGLFGWLAESRVSHIHGTPQIFGIIGAGRSGNATLRDARYLFSGGDSLRRARAVEMAAMTAGATVVNFYGTTETPQAMGFHVFDPTDSQDPVPVGAGIADTQLLVLDEQGAVAPTGITGQVAVRTAYLSAGYLNSAEETRQRFRSNPHATGPDDRLYLTGDRGYFRADDAAVVVTGRADDQVKVRGFRVELGEICAQLECLPSVRAAAVLPDPLARGETRLVAYLVGSGDTTSVRAALSAALPPYMVPALYVWLPELPLLPNGKIDRNRLVPPSAAPSETDADDAVAAGSAEDAIAQKWRALLGVATIRADQSFADLGGDSLSFIQASAHLEKLLGPLSEGWERLPIRQLAARAPTPPSRWSTVDASVLVRAVAILLVVLEHLANVGAMASTQALFVVAGMSFARYQLSAVLRADQITPALRSAFKIVLPTFLYTAAIEIRYSSLKWQALLLVNNFVDPDFDGGFTYWFVDVLVQNQLLLCLLLAFPAVRSLARRRPFAVGWAAWLASVVVSVGVSRVWDTHALYDRVPHKTLPFMFLGWALAKADRPALKGICFLSGLALFALPLLDHESVQWMPLAAFVLLVCTQRIALPRSAAAVTNLVAGASLFIYLTHYQSAALVHKIRALDHPPIVIVFVVGAGIASWKLWQFLASIAGQTLRRLRAQRSEQL